MYYYLLVGNTLALLAISMDQLIVFGKLQGSARFLVSTIHPAVFFAAVILVVMYVHRRMNASIIQAAAAVLPSMLFGGPIPGLIFR